MNIAIRFIFILFISSIANVVSGQEHSRYQRIYPTVRHDPTNIQQWDNWINTHMNDHIPHGTRLVLDRFRQSPGGYHYEFKHMLGAYPIEGSGLKLTVKKDGTVWSCMNFIQPLRNSTTIRSKWGGGSQEEYLKSVIVSSDIYDYHIDTCYVIERGIAIPAWKVTLYYNESAGSELVYISTHTGEELSRIDRTMYNTARQDTKALARVFLPDPCTRGRVRYGELFEDNEDAHAPIFDQLMDTVVLRDLTYENDTFWLKGPYVEVVDLAPRTIPPAFSTDGTFYFTREESGFEDVMVYYHIDSYQRYIQSLGFTNLWNRPIRVDPHGLGFSDQSQFVPMGDQSYIRYGEGGVDDAEDADVIIHEYIHALSYAASGNDMMSCERRGLDEGYADYFAAGYSKDLDEWDWENLLNWDGHNPFYQGRMVISNVQYPLASCSKIANVNDWGELWASAAMRIRNEIGDEPADRIFLQALYGGINDMGFRDAVSLVLEADTLLYNGKHSDWINFHFCQQGIINDGGCLSVSTPIDIKKVSKSLRINISQSEGAVTFLWDHPYPGDNPQIRVEIYNLMGQNVFTGMLDRHNKWNQKIFLPAGIYAYHVSQDKQRFDSGKIFVQRL